MTTRSILLLGALVALPALAAPPAAAQPVACPSSVNLSGNSTLKCTFSSDTLTFGGQALATLSGETVTLNQGWVYVVSPSTETEVEKTVQVTTTYGTAGASSGRRRNGRPAVDPVRYSTTPPTYLVYLQGTAGNLTAGSLALVSGGMDQPGYLDDGCQLTVYNNAQGRRERVISDFTQLILNAFSSVGRNLSDVTCEQK